jgi:hypothetical protein
MIEQTIPLRQLTAGMANCIREWILPHLTDAMARIQADQLIAMLNELPRAVAPAALARIRADSDEARAVLARAGLSAPGRAASEYVDDLMAENAALKERLEALAARCRQAGDAASAGTLLDVQRFFVASAKREGVGAAVKLFEEMTARDREGKQDLKQGA